MKVENVSVSISSETNYNKTNSENTQTGWHTLNVSVKSDSREFLEKISQSVHRELSIRSGRIEGDDKP